MASPRLLLRLSRDLARAARVFAARRRAELPVAPSSGSGGLASLPSSSRRRGGDGPQPTTQGSSDAPAPCPGLSKSNLRTADYGSHKSPPGWREVEFLVEEGDLESDQAMLTLYMRWCLTFNQQRDLDEILLRFDRFKTMVRFLASAEEKSRSPYTLKLTPFTDGKYSRAMGDCSHVAPRGTRFVLLSARKPTSA